MAGKVLRAHVEEACAEELAALAQQDGPRPVGWNLTPRAVRTFLLGGEASDGTVIAAKYIGDATRIEVAIATLATERALLLEGDPGTGKSWVSEHLAAAISGDSTLLVQGTAGTDEPALRYGWNYARLLSEGPSPEALVESPVVVAMRTGRIARVEELTRIPSEVQDALLTVLSEKSLPIVELGREVQAVEGFNLIATANSRDRGVNALSSALQRRFATVRLEPPATLAEEVAVVTQRLDPAVPLNADALTHTIERVVRVFRELRQGLTEDGKTKLRSPSGALSTAEAIAVLSQGAVRAAYYGTGEVGAEHVVDGIVGVVVRDERDGVALREYADAVLADRDGWQTWARALSDRI